MAALFDVYVVGGAEVTPPGSSALAAALAGRLGMAMAVVSKGLADRKLCAAQGMDVTTAQALVRELRGLGATSMMRPSAAPAAPPAAAGYSESAIPTRAGGPPSPPPPPARPAPPATDTPALAMGMSLELGDPPPAPSSSARPAPGKAYDPFAPPPSSPDLGLGLGLAAGGRGSSPPASAPPPVASRPAGDKFVPREAHEPSLELDDSRGGSSQDLRRNTAGAAAMSAGRMTATSSGSGLAVDKDAAAEAYRIRCPTHGLFFDTRKASGCRKCLEPGRKMSADMEDEARGVKVADFENSPVKRAFMGLAIALVVGFIPAAYHSLRIGARELHRLRDEQEMLSRKPATEEIVRQFQELDTQVGEAKNKSMRNTGLLWVVVTGGTLIGWYRLTS